MRATSGWRTTSALVRRVKAMPRTSFSTWAASARPLFWPRARSDLGAVARDHCLAAKADARQEHLHLLWCGVLRLIQNDEGMIQGSATHVGQRCNLDGLLLEQFDGPVKAEQIVQRVVQRAQIRVDFLGQVAGQKAEPLSGFDCGSRQHQAFHGIALKRVNRGGHRKIGLAGAGRTDTEGDVGRQNVLQIITLVRGYGPADRPSWCVAPALSLA